MVPKWPARALGAIVALFRPLQDIDVYVEDADSEEFYKALLGRVLPEGVRLKRVFPLNGKPNVLARAASHNFAARPALFLVDGDFGWVRGEAPPTTPGVYRLEAYCIENLLICELAATEVLMDCEACEASAAKSVLDFTKWVADVEGFVDLFIAWAALNQVSPSTSTVSTGIGQFLDGGKAPVSLDLKKVEKARQAAREALAAHAHGEALCAEIEQRVRALPFKLDAVSGKDFVLPALEFRIRSLTKEKCNRKVLKFRLARRVAPERLSGLAAAILRAAQGENQHV